MTNNAFYSPTDFINSGKNDGEIVSGTWRNVLTDDGGASRCSFEKFTKCQRFKVSSRCSHTT